MQLTPNVEFWLRVAAIVVPAISAIPAIVAAVLGYRLGRRMANYQKELNKELALYQSGLQTSLAKELESHKRDLSKELEGYKFELQSSFQTRFYEFQTRYSLLHQKKAEAIEKLFSLSVRVQKDLRGWVNSGVLRQPPTDEIHEVFAEQQFRELQERFREMEEFYEEKRIYFDQETQKYMLLLTALTRSLYVPPIQIQEIEKMKIEFPDQVDQSKVDDGKMVQHINLLMSLLEDRFKQLLEAESPAPSSVREEAASAGLSQAPGISSQAAP